VPDERSGAGRQTLSGRVGPADPDWDYVPVEVPAGCRRLTVRLSYDRALGVIDLGLFAPGGRFRGWSGGARTEFTVAAADATPGYLAGPLPAGTWQVVLGPYRVPAGGLAWELEVEAAATAGRPAVATAAAGPGGDGPERVLRDAPGWYRGDLHVHTIYSDGGRAPAEVLALARSAGLDFLVTSEHNTSAGHQAFARCQRPDLLLVAGEEVTTRAGHAGAIGVAHGRWVDWRYRPADGVLPAIAGQLRAEGALLQANHPFSAPRGAGWEFGWDEVDAVEVWNGSESQPVNDRAVTLWDGLLRTGRALVATGGSDAHRPGDQVGYPQTVVMAERLAQAEVVAAIRAGRCWLATSSEVELEFVALAGGRAAGIGEHLPGGDGEPVRLRLRVAGAPAAVATFHGQDGTAHAAQLGPDRAGTVVWETRLGTTSWLRAEVRQPDGTMVALTNPIWLGPAPRAAALA
jgi:PHP-associated